MRGPREFGPVHFVGIGGIGMSGIAEVMNTLGYRVQGSDMAENYNVARLRKLGVEVHLGHRPENLADAQVVVVSSAVKVDNPEVREARRRYLPIVRRAEMLAELMRFKSCVAVGGTHGKTTTTSIVACLLDAAGLDPTVINGGIINAYGTNARLGAGEWMVVESDESDGTFVKLPADVAIVTNIDPEHLDHYGDFEGVKKAFLQFVENVPFYGFAVMCLDHPGRAALPVADLHREDRPALLGPEIEAADVGLRVEAIGDDAAILDPPDQRLDFRMVDAHRGEAVEGDVLDELPEGVLHPLEIAVMVEMLGVDIGDQRDVGRQLDEGPVGFVGLDHHPAARPHARIGAVGVDDAAIDHRRVEAAGIQQRRHHRRRRRLAMRAGDGD